jgi:lipopolysaccharide biosynthesis regulator YciM
MLGVLYARAGMVDEAEREFQALVESNSNSSVARSLLLSVREWRLSR